MRTREVILANISPLHAFTATLVGEVMAEPVDGVIAVGCVIRNRVNADIWGDKKPDWWGEGYAGVCLKSWQFSCWWEKNTNSERVYEVADSLISNVAPTSVPAPRIKALASIAQLIMDNQIPDITGGADHYLTTALLRSNSAPAWAKKNLPLIVIGSHTFYKLENWKN